MLCEKCGKEVKAGAKFCDKCGAPIQQKEKMILPKIDKRILCISIICAVVIVLFGISRLWKYMFPSADMRLVRTENSHGQWSEYNYDEIGNLVKISYYEKDGNDNGWIEYSYDETGNIVEERGYSVPGQWGGEFYLYPYPVYDVDYLKRSINPYYRIIHDYHRNNYRIEYEYDAVGNKIKVNYSYFDNSGAEFIEWRWVGSYGNSGNLVKETMMVADGTDGDEHWFKHEAEYSYDSSGNPVKGIIKYANGGMDVFDYDSLGNIVKIFPVYEYSYDNEGKLIKENREDTYYTKYSYNKSGNLVGKIQWDIDARNPKDYEDIPDISDIPDIYRISDRYKSSLDIMECKYRYDRAGNLIEARITDYDRQSSFWIKYTYK